MNLIYTRMRPAGSLARTLIITYILDAIRLATWVTFRAGSLLFCSAARNNKPSLSPEHIYAL